MASRGLTLGPSVVAAGTALTLVLFFASARQNVDEMRILRDESARIQHTLDVQRDLDSVLIAVSEADAAVRSFLLTDQPESLDGYRTAREALVSRVDLIATLTSDSVGQQERAAKLRTAVTARMESLNAMVEARRAGSLHQAAEEARAVDVNGPDDQIRTLIADMEIAEAQALAERRDEAGRAYQRAVNGRVVAGVISAALLIAIAGIAGFHARTKAKREVELVASERRARESAVREQEARAEAEGANRQKDQFLAVLSHELRTPLNAVLGWTQILQTAGPSESTIVRALASIRRNAETQQRLVEDLLDVSRIISGKLPFEKEPFNLRVAVSAAVESIRPAVGAKGLTLESDLENTRPVMGDPGRIQQVAGNLLSNAVKFTPKGGTVSVHTQARPDAVEISVDDTGVGIAPEDQGRIFEEFGQAKEGKSREGSTGLGLTLAKRFVELHGGAMTLRSTVGQGSTFTFVLPLRRSVGSPGEASSTSA